MLYALITATFSLFYLIGNPEVLSLESITIIKEIASIMMIYVAVLLLTVGKMRFTPIMFLLMGLIMILTSYSTGLMIIGCGIMFIIIGLFAILRTESRILPGLMLIFGGSTTFVSILSGGIMPSIPWLSAVLNGIPALIAIYLSFVVYSQRKLPRF